MIFADARIILSLFHEIRGLHVFLTDADITRCRSFVWIEISVFLGEKIPVTFVILQIEGNETCGEGVVCCLSKVWERAVAETRTEKNASMQIYVEFRKAFRLENLRRNGRNRHVVAK